MQGDCIDRMKDLPDNSVHCIISDIPYGIDFAEWDVIHNNSNKALLGSSPAQQKSSLFKTRGKPKNGWSEADRQRPKQFQDFCEKWLAEGLRVLKPAGSIVCLTGRQMQHRFTIAAENAGLVYKDTVAWDKQHAPFRAQSVNKVLEKRNLESVSSSLRLGSFAPQFEPIVWCFKPYKVGTTITDAFLADGVGLFDSQVIKSNIVSVSGRLREEKVHDTQKPLMLMETLVRCFTLDGQTVLDPFMGSGTTGVACINKGRNFIGIEKDKKYFEIAKERIENALGTLPNHLEEQNSLFHVPTRCYKEDMELLSTKN
jgi:site-specific DNA-methyltransferase (adenine-specific)